MIRRADMRDLDDVVRMGRAFFEETGFAAETSFDEASARRTVEHMIGGGGIVLMAERGGRPVGMAGAITFPYYFNVAARAGQELFWWMEPDARGGWLGVQLLKALESWARGEGCVTFTMVSLPALAGPAAKLYGRFGYRPSECSFIKKVA